MLKIWLTWLQPSLGVLGTALVLSNPLCAFAATKPAAPRTITKAPTQSTQWSSLKSAGTRIDRELLAGMSVTPDFAVRQLAIKSLGTPVTPTTATKTRQINRNPVASFVSPGAKFPQFSAKATKPTQPNAKKADVASALARAINPTSATVPGIYIGNSNPRVASKFMPTGKPVAVPVEIGAPTPLSAMMAAKTNNVDPYPVVRPELMQKLERDLAANLPTAKKPTYPLDPVAAIPAPKAQAVAPKTVFPPVKSTPYRSLDPIATIPSGLQQLLGNNLNSQPIGSSATVASANSKSINPMLALRQLVSPSMDLAPTAVNTASLQLATAQAYTNTPKFNIPGETLLTAKQFKPVTDLLVTKSTPKSFTISATSNRQSNYVTTLASTPKQAWTAVSQRNNLGGLILGSQPLPSTSRVASLLPVDSSAKVGLPARALVDFN